MSLHMPSESSIPEETLRVARAAFPKGTLCMRLRDALGPIFTDEHFADLFAVRGRPAEAPWRLDPYLPYLRQRWEDGCQNGTQLWRDVQSQGFTGSRALVSRYVACLRHPDLLHRPEAEAVVRRSYVPRRAVWLFLRDPETLTANERADLRQMQTNCPEAEHLYPLASAFRHLVVQRQEEALDAWMEQARSSGVPEFCRFADGLQHDLSAVRAALHYPWSSGQVEGQVNRLKAIKRQMYGRAKFSLLVRRVLLGPSCWSTPNVLAIPTVLSHTKQTHQT